MSSPLQDLTYPLEFLGFEASFEEAEAVVFGAPFDNTASYRPGTRFAAGQMRRDSYYLELYSPRQDRSLEDHKIHDASDLVLPWGNPARVLTLIEEATEAILAQDKLPVMIGGEHLVTLGTIRAFAKKYPDLHMVHFDAHTDLRETFFDEPLSHATVIRKCWDILGDGRIHSYGIRSGVKEEFDWAKIHTDFHPFSLNGIEEVRAKIGRSPVYITLDLDVLDPSVMPGTGTPEPGGATFNELLEAMLKLTGLNIVGFDINELSPPYDPSGISSAAACKLLREMLLMALAKA